MKTMNGIVIVNKDRPWISVEDEMPSIGQRVLTHDGNDFCIKVYRFGEFEHWNCELCNVTEVTHWQPLPEKPL